LQIAPTKQGIDSFVFKHEMTSGVADNELELTAHSNDRSAARFSPILGDPACTRQ